MILMTMLRTQFRHGKPRASGDDPGLAVFYFDAD